MQHPRQRLRVGLVVQLIPIVVERVNGIRSALLRGSAAFLYAGCGIVGDSDPDLEFEESRLKLQPMLWALNGK